MIKDLMASEADGGGRAEELRLPRMRHLLKEIAVGVPCLAAYISKLKLMDIAGEQAQRGSRARPKTLRTSWRGARAALAAHAVRLAAQSSDFKPGPTRRRGAPTRERGPGPLALA